MCWNTDLPAKGYCVAKLLCWFRWNMGKLVEGKKKNAPLSNISKYTETHICSKLKMVEPWRVSYNPALFSLRYVGSMIRKS